MVKYSLFEAYKKLLSEEVANSIIIDAIENHQIVRFNYAPPNAESGERIGEIYAFGQTRKGNDAISVYQTAGKTSSVISNWKIFLVEYISNMQLVREYFKPRREFNPDPNGNKQMPKIYNIVEF